MSYPGPAGSVLDSVRQFRLFRVSEPAAPRSQPTSVICISDIEEEAGSISTDAHIARIGSLQCRFASNGPDCTTWSGLYHLVRIVPLGPDCTSRLVRIV